MWNELGGALLSRPKAGLPDTRRPADARSRGPTERLGVLGVGVNAVNVATAVDCIDQWIERGERKYVCVTGVHGVMESVRDPRIAEIHNAAGLVTPDGMPLAWLLRHAGFAEASRVCGRDLMAAVFERGERHGYRHYLYGASPETLELLRARLLQRFPQAEIVGAYAPPFRPAGAMERDDILAGINDSGADIVWVGLSTPKQELWMANHRRILVAPALIGVGAAFDFHAGLLREAPKVLQRAGLEWAYRLALEPRRLAARYLRNNPQFILLLLADRLGVVRSWSGRGALQTDRAGPHKAAMRGS